MNVHKHARMTVHGRYLVVCRVRREGLRVRDAALVGLIGRWKPCPMVISLAEGAPERNTEWLHARCPEWVKTGHSPEVPPTSALGGKADIVGSSRNVCF